MKSSVLHTHGEKLRVISILWGAGFVKPFIKLMVIVFKPKALILTPRTPGHIVR